MCAAPIHPQLQQHQQQQQLQYAMSPGQQMVYAPPPQMMYHPGYEMHPHFHSTMQPIQQSMYSIDISPAAMIKSKTFRVPWTGTSCWNIHDLRTPRSNVPTRSL